MCMLLVSWGRLLFLFVACVRSVVVSWGGNLAEYVPPLADLSKEVEKLGEAMAELSTVESEYNESKLAKALQQVCMGGCTPHSVDPFAIVDQCGGGGVLADIGAIPCTGFLS